MEATIYNTISYAGICYDCPYVYRFRMSQIGQIRPLAEDFVSYEENN